MSSSQDDDKTIVSIPAPWQSQGLVTARSCPKCGLVVTDNTMVCPVDNTAIFEAPGKVLADSYEFMSVTGWGGMSVIYKARQRATGHIVAIKMLHSLLMTEQSLKRFQQEAKAIMSLRHPNIIIVHDFGVSEHGQPYMVMDFIEGKTLADVIKDTGGLSLEASLPRFIQLCDALDHAHSVGVLHRDLKPSNIMISNLDGNFEDARIVDFGIAKLLDKEGAQDEGHLTQTGELFGSPLYMSPEQCRGSQVDARTDIYSMGCVMYETLTGRPPFKGATIVDTLMMQMSETPDSLQEASAGKKFSRQVEDVIAKTLAKDPDDRYQTMRDLEMALMSIQPNQQIVSQPLRSSKNKKATVIPKFVYGAALAFVLVALIFFAWWQRTYKPDQTAAIKAVEMNRNEAVQNFLKAKRDQEYISTNIQKLLRVNHNSINAAMLQQSLAIDLGLTELDLNNSMIGDVGGRCLRNQMSLKNVYLDNTFVKDETVYVLAHLPDLEKVSLKNTKISDNAFDNLPQPKHMFGLYLDDANAFGDKSLDNITRMTKLKELSIKHTAVTDEGFKNLRRVSLNKLWASHTKFGDKGMDALAHMDSLTDLYLRDTKVTEEGLSKLINAPKLSELDLSAIHLTDKGMASLDRFPNLTYLRISNNPITDSGTEVFKKLPKLQRLILESTKITDKGLLNLLTLPELRELNLKDDQITDGAVETICHLTSLQRLNLTGTKITDAGLKKLQNNKQLDTVMLTNCKNLTLPAIREFKQRDPNCQVYVMQSSDRD